jgi:hypothetical protein
MWYLLMDLNQRVINGIMVYVMGYWYGFANLPGFVVQHEFGFFLGGLIWFQWDVFHFTNQHIKMEFNQPKIVGKMGGWR